jgi:hypothetical protein
VCKNTCIGIKQSNIAICALFVECVAKWKLKRILHKMIVVLCMEDENARITFFFTFCIFLSKWKLDDDKSEDIEVKHPTRIFFFQTRKKQGFSFNVVRFISLTNNQ